MERHNVQELIRKYNAEQATPDDMKVIEEMIESGLIDLEDLQEVNRLSESVMNFQSKAPSPDLDDRFYQMLALKKKAGKSFSWSTFFSWPELIPKLAFASVALIIGLSIGYFVKPASNPGTEQMQALTQQVTDLKEMMMLSLLEKESATDRLRAVSLTQDMNKASTKVTSALIATLNNDDNINVRLAALDALKPYVRSGEVRAELIHSIAKQESPLVQVALAELMAQLQEKSSVKEFDKIIQSDKTPDDVKKKIQENLEVLI